MRSFYGVWQMANKLDQKCTSLSLKFGVLFVGEIDQQIFFVRQKLFAWKKIC
jgi:hypothetical protein